MIQKRILAIAVLLLMMSMTAIAQDTTGVTIGDTLLPPHPSAVLELKSVNKGFLTTRLTTAQRDSISDPANGLLVYNTDLSRYFYYADTTWRDLSGLDFWKQNDSMAHIFFTEGNVGIGIDTPELKLHVSGNVSLEYEGYGLLIDTSLLGFPVTGSVFYKVIDTSKLVVSGIFLMEGEDSPGFYTIYRNATTGIISNLSVYEGEVIATVESEEEGVSVMSMDIDRIGLGIYGGQTSESVLSNLVLGTDILGLQKTNSGSTISLAFDSTAANLAFASDSSINNYLRLDGSQFKLNFYKEDTISELSAGSSGLNISLRIDTATEYFANFQRTGTLETNFKIETDSSIDAGEYLLNGTPINFGGVWQNTGDKLYVEGKLVGIGTSNPVTSLQVEGDVKHKLGNAYWVLMDTVSIGGETLNGITSGFNFYENSTTRAYNIYNENMEDDNGGFVTSIMDTTDETGSHLALFKERITALNITDSTVSGMGITESGLAAFGADNGTFESINNGAVMSLSKTLGSMGYVQDSTYAASVLLSDFAGFTAGVNNEDIETQSQLGISPNGTFFITLNNNDVNPAVDFSIANGWLYKGKDTTATMFILQDSLERDLFYVKNNSRAYFKGNVGINITNPSEKLHVDGNILASGSITQNSDARLKTGITTITNSLSKLSLLRGVSYFWKDKEKSTQQQLGLIAQEVEKIYPELVGSDNNGNKTVNYIGLIAPLLEAVKELKDRVEVLEQENKTLKAEK